MPAAPNTYELARQRATEQANTQAQSQNDAIRRRFASLGNLNSGAAIKQQQIAQDQANQQRERAISEINAQEADMQGQRDFQREMQSTQHQFQAGQSDKDRAQQMALQDRGFSFQGGENALQRALQQRMQQEGFAFQGGENALQRALQQQMQQEGFTFQRGESALERQQQANQFAKQFGLQQQTFEKEYGRGGYKEQAMEMAKREADMNELIARINAQITAAGIDDDDLRAQIMSQVLGSALGNPHAIGGGTVNPQSYAAPKAIAPTKEPYRPWYIN
jgi:hypothetical protein